eukprot:TRINITY_DN91222_c0_g1_i1.p1 TRINITY_DN91222_c0_g1~~TRINITY_DN91222_c0_g1_i1.p1  ORF type:complete len:710 (-),score=132.45 TRINITY_DN91222_c0_g1_i1:108-1991(-)
MHVANHAGWSALALAGNGGMKGAQQIVVRKVDGNFVAEDRYSEAYSQPTLSDEQDVSLIFATEEGGSVTWSVMLPVDSCKSAVANFSRNYPIQNVSRWMHWALGSDHNFAYHSTSRGQFHANLISGPSEKPSFDNLLEVDIRMPNASVVLGEGGTDATNPYVCGIFDLEKMLPSSRSIDDKHHVVKFAPYLNADSEKYVHHMILYACPDGQGISYEHGQIVPECESMPTGCYEMKWPWAVGSQDVIFPAGVGMPFGEGKRWLALQMHYYNPRLDPDVKDSSGVRLIFADTPGSQDAGVMQFNGGTSPRMRSPLPAGEKELKLSWTTPSECTEMWRSDINVLGTVHHSHLLGSYMTLEVMNGGEWKGLLRNENRYDFNHQSLEEGGIKMLKRGDAIRMTCVYDTTQKTEPTTFGDLTQQEMCYAAALYYPVQDMNSPTYREVSQFEELGYRGACQAPGSGAYSEVSACEMLWMTDIYYLFTGKASGAFAVSATTACNQYYQMIEEASPGICPCKDGSCTDEIMTPAGKAYCTGLCAQAGLSLYPNMSKATMASKTFCGWKDVWYEAPDVKAPACLKKGDLSSSAAETLVAKVKDAAGVVDSTTNFAKGATVPGLMALGALGTVWTFCF